MKLMHLIKNFHFRTLSYLYLVTPVLIFASGWLNLTVALLFIAAALAGMYFVLKDAKPLPKDLRINVGQCMLVLTIAIIWAGSSGIGGFGFQNSDYEKHNAVLNDLINHSWPVIFNNGNYLVYSFAYYLPAAGFGKLFGWTAANIFIFAWAVIGIFLALQWFIALIGKPTVWVALIFVFLGGMDFLGTYLIKGYIPNYGDHLEWWASFAQFSSATTQLYWVPQHGVGGWLLTGLMLHEIWHNKTLANCGFLIALSVFWSPLVAIGLMLIACYAAAAKVPHYVSFSNLLIAPVVGLVLAIFILGNSFHHPYEFIWKSYPILSNVPQYLLFFPLEVGVFAALLFTNVKALGRVEKNWFLFATISLAVLSLLKFGATNDLVMRSSIPLLFLFWVIAIRSMLTITCEINFKTTTITICLIITFLGSISEMERAQRYFTIRVADQNTIKSTPEVLLGDQYLGNNTSVYVKYLAP